MFSVRTGLSFGEREAVLSDLIEVNEIPFIDEGEEAPGLDGDNADSDDDDDWEQRVVGFSTESIFDMGNPVSVHVDIDYLRMWYTIPADMPVNTLRDKFAQLLKPFGTSLMLSTSAIRGNDQYAFKRLFKAKCQNGADCGCPRAHEWLLVITKHPALVLQGTQEELIKFQQYFCALVRSTPHRAEGFIPAGNGDDGVPQFIAKRRHFVQTSEMIKAFAGAMAESHSGKVGKCFLWAHGFKAHQQTAVGDDMDDTKACCWFDDHKALFESTLLDRVVRKPELDFGVVLQPHEDTVPLGIALVKNDSVYDTKRLLSRMGNGHGYLTGKTGPTGKGAKLYNPLLDHTASDGGVKDAKPPSHYNGGPEKFEKLRNIQAIRRAVLHAPLLDDAEDDTHNGGDDDGAEERDTILQHTMLNTEMAPLQGQVLRFERPVVLEVGDYCNPDGIVNSGVFTSFVNGLFGSVSKVKRQLRNLFGQISYLSVPLSEIDLEMQRIYDIIRRQQRAGDALPTETDVRLWLRLHNAFGFCHPVDSAHIHRLLSHHDVQPAGIEDDRPIVAVMRAGEAVATMLQTMIGTDEAIPPSVLLIFGPHYASLRDADNDEWIRHCTAQGTVWVMQLPLGARDGYARDWDTIRTDRLYQEFPRLKQLATHVQKKVALTGNAFSSASRIWAASATQVPGCTVPFKRPTQFLAAAALFSVPGTDDTNRARWTQGSGFSWADGCSPNDVAPLENDNNDNSNDNDNGPPILRTRVCISLVDGEIVQGFQLMSERSLALTDAGTPVPSPVSTPPRVVGQIIADSPRGNLHQMAVGIQRAANRLNEAIRVGHARSEAGSEHSSVTGGAGGGGGGADHWKTPHSDDHYDFGNDSDRYIALEDPSEDSQEDGEGFTNAGARVGTSRSASDRSSPARGAGGAAARAYDDDNDRRSLISQFALQMRQHRFDKPPHWAHSQLRKGGVFSPK